MMLHKFTFKFLSVFCIIIGIVCYYRLRVEPYISGDLCKMLCLPLVSPNYENLIEEKTIGKYELETQDIDIYNGIDTCDYELLIIGDSFTNAIGKGQTPYSLLLGHLSGLKTARYTGDLQTFVNLLNKGFILPRTYVVVESVERYAISRFENIDFSKMIELSLDKETSGHEITNAKNNTTRFSCMTRACVWLRSLLNIGPKPKALDVKLSTPMFSNEINSETLLFYEQDLNFRFREVDSVTKIAIHNNLLHARQMADSVGVNLLFLVAADKYDLYYPWVINPATTENHTFDCFPCDSAYFIDTKALLRPYAEQGVKDIYKFSDTHWSTVGSYIVALEVLKRFEIENLRNKNFHFEID